MSVGVFAILNLLVRKEPGYDIGLFTTDTTWKSRDLVRKKLESVFFPLFLKNCFVQVRLPSQWDSSTGGDALEKKTK